MVYTLGTKGLDCKIEASVIAKIIWGIPEVSDTLATNSECGTLVVIIITQRLM